MELFEIHLTPHPSDSYSRQLDNRVAMQEMPYGYEHSPPPADTGNFDEYSRESHKQYGMHKGRAI